MVSTDEFQLRDVIFFTAIVVFLITGILCVSALMESGTSTDEAPMYPVLDSAPRTDEQPIQANNSTTNRPPVVVSITGTKE
jgi:hypothetical protein